ncbi:hypothetical protein [Pseudonocardia sp. TRM90224]|uniref:hypothetical protein n=1 Tax=Pseudonocardia sp. TRM90224 TaxID=2812678 RepID=UPI001E50944B|nr:hypothetical protein [Pseudonocardia sp. TRM90224]
MNARSATVIGLVTGAVGIAILYVAGVAMPIIPPGMVLLLAAALLVGSTRMRWAPVLGVVIALSEIAGFVLSGSFRALVDLDPVTIFGGTWVRLAGVVLATVAGVVATVQNYRGAPVAA